MYIPFAYISACLYIRTVNRIPQQNTLFRALSDPTRREMLLLLSSADRTVNELASPFEMSQPAVSQHLKVLRDAGLVTVEQRGRERWYHIDPAPLKEIYDWLTHFERFWTAKLDSLGTYLNRKR